MAAADDLRDLARTQRCLFTTDQALALGMTRSALAHRVRSGELVRLAPRLYCIGGVAPTTEIGLRGALLESGGFSALCRSTAAAHWDYPGFQLDPIQVVRARDGMFRPMVTATRHTTTTLPPDHVVDHDGLLITTPARTLFDLAAIVHPIRLERLVDHAWAHRQVSGRLMHRTLMQLSAKGRTGITVMRAILAERGPEYRPPDSAQEGRFIQLLKDDCQVPMERQADLGGIDWLARVDFVDCNARLVVEIDSDLHHLSITDQRADHARQRALEQTGWTVLRISEFDLWHNPRDVVARVRRARGVYAERTTTPPASC